MTVAALYVDIERGPYASMLGVDCWGVERNAKEYTGPHPVVAHPPCGPWGQLAHLCNKQDPACGPMAVEQVYRYGGVLEHPAGSRLWQVMSLPKPGEFTRDGLWTLEVDQCRWGHPCRKRTWLLFSGISRYALGALPVHQEPTHVIDTSSAEKRRRKAIGAPVRHLPKSRRHLPKSRRHLTPPVFALWLVALARTAQR